MSSTYEAALNTASNDYKASRVRRIVELAHMPRLPPCLFALEAAATALGWVLRKVARLDSHFKGTYEYGYKEDPETDEPVPNMVPFDAFPLDGGWRRRPAFRWEQPDYRPSDDEKTLAERALELTREHLRGGADAALKSSQGQMRRLVADRDGVATRGATRTIVTGIVKAEVGELKQRLGSLEEKMDALLAHLQQERK